jgi:hypothetical protein
MKPLLNSKAVCEILDIKRATLSRMVHAGKIPYVLLGTGRKKLTVSFEEELSGGWTEDCQDRHLRPMGRSGRRGNTRTHLIVSSFKGEPIMTPVCRNGARFVFNGFACGSMLLPTYCQQTSRINGIPSHAHSPRVNHV